MSIRRTALGLLFPNRCDCCGSRIPAEPLLCEACMQKLSALHITAGDWRRCGGADIGADGIAVRYSYQGAVQRGILAAKEGHRGFAAYAGMQLADAVRQQLPGISVSCVTWVPVSAARKRVQGYCHAELFGTALAAALALPVRDGLLTDGSRKLRQHDLPAAKRAEYAQLRFSHTGADLSGMQILLCDDVLTTGNTLRNCVRLLRECGAAKVYIAAAAARLLQREESE